MNQIVQHYFAKQPEVLAAYLFGSRAKGIARLSSDIDIAVLLTADFPSRDFLAKRLEWMSELSSLLDGEVDIAILNEGGPVLTHQVYAHGRLLYEKNHDLVTAFKAKALIEYVDWLPYKKRLDKSVMEHFGKRAYGQS